jgi:hypothetical protein
VPVLADDRHIPWTISTMLKAPNWVVATAANLRRAGDEKRPETFGAVWALI